MGTYVSKRLVNVTIFMPFQPSHSNSAAPSAALPELCLLGKENKTREWANMAMGKGP